MLLATTSLTALTALTASAALGQSLPTSQPETVGEVIVTATAVAEAIRDVPVSVTAVAPKNYNR